MVSKSDIRDYVRDVFDWGLKIQSGPCADQSLVDYNRQLLSKCLPPRRPPERSLEWLVTPEPFYGNPNAKVLLIGNNPRITVGNSTQPPPDYFFYSKVDLGAYYKAVISAHQNNPLRSNAGQEETALLKRIGTLINGTDWDFLNGQGIKTNMVLVRSNKWSEDKRSIESWKQIEKHCRDIFLPKLLQIIEPSVIISVGSLPYKWLRLPPKQIFKVIEESSPSPLGLPNRYGKSAGTDHAQFIVVESVWGNPTVITFFGQLCKPWFPSQPFINACKKIIRE